MSNYNNDLIVDLQKKVNELEAKLKAYEQPSGAYQCFHCCSPHSVVWDCDYDYSDFGYEGEGIVQMCHCTECGAEIEYRIPC